ncbi:MAG: MFS transporter [Acidimicrobiia bacterium]
MSASTDPHMEMTPFSRLAVAQAASIAGDTCLNVALAGSIFFTLNPSQARSKVLLFLVCTMLPFVLLSPLIGPALDRSRSGRRLVVAACAMGRAICLFTLALYINDPPPRSYLLFPLAFGALMFSKGHNVAKSSLVPAVVRGQQTFVKANSRLAIISVISGAAAAAPAVALFKFVGSAATLRLGAVVFVVCTLFALRIPKAPIVSSPLSEAAKAELHARSIVLSGTLMALIRSGVGFLTLLTAFWIKSAGQTAIAYGLVGAAAAAGNLGGVLAAPGIRTRVREETILASAAIGAGITSLLCARFGNLAGLCIAASVVAVSAAASRLSFDALVQRDAPDAMRGRVFARYETRFQLTWVIGAVIPALISISNRVGLFILAVGGIGAGLMYVAGLRRMRESRGAASAPVEPTMPTASLGMEETLGIDVSLGDIPDDSSDGRKAPFRNSAPETSVPEVAIDEPPSSRAD